MRDVGIYDARGREGRRGDTDGAPCTCIMTVLVHTVSGQEFQRHGSSLMVTDMNLATWSTPDGKRRARRQRCLAFSSVHSGVVFPSIFYPVKISPGHPRGQSRLLGGPQF
jgi:hypothetical protein